MLLSQTSEYALRAVLHIAARSRPVSVGEIAEAVGVPQNYLSKTLHQLARAGVLASAMAVERDRRGRIVTEPTMRSVSHPEVWAIGDCASIPGPDGKPYPALAQHAIREARAVAANVRAAAEGRAPTAFIFRALGTMAAFGHTRAAADVRGLFLTGFIAWWMRRTYYLFQMPRWDTRLRIALDWTISLFFRPDLTKVDPAVEREQERRNCAAGASRAPQLPNEGQLSALGSRLSATASGQPGAL